MADLQSVRDKIKAALDEDNAAIAALPAPTPGPTPTPTPTPQPTAPSARVNISMIPVEAPSWNYADTKARFFWKKPGGDWSDASGTWWVTTLAGAYATATVKTYTPTMLTFNVNPALIEKLRAFNSGIMLRAVSGFAKIAGSLNTTYPGPSLSVVTSTGTFHCSLLVNMFIASSANVGLVDKQDLSSPVLLKFDLSAVTGAVQSATLTATASAMYTIPCTFGLYYLETPEVVFDPATQIGGVVQGIAATVEHDHDLASHPSVVAYNAFDSAASVAADIASCSWTLANTNENNSGAWTQDPQYPAWSEFGFSVARVTIPVSTGGVNGCSMQRWCSPVFPTTNANAKNWNRSWTRDLRKGFNKLYFRYVVMLYPDVEDGIDYVAGGVKMPGLMGSYEFYPYDNQAHFTDGLNPEKFGVAWNPSADGYWAYRPEHIPASKTNPHLFPLSFYLYDHMAPIGTGSGAAPMVSHNFSFTPGHKYCLEMGVQLNTQNADGTWNADGVVQMWIDGVLLFNVIDRLIRQDARIQFQDIPHFRFYHGGRTSPVAPIHYDVGAVCIATEYIGPPKRAP